MEAKLKQLFSILEIQPNNQQYYLEALTHKTYTNETKDTKSYEKLEFLGDSILQFKASLFIYQNFTNKEEGIMSNIRAKNVSKEALAKIIREYKINEFLICGNNKDDLKNNIKICSDLFESLAAAIYLDLGEKAVDEFLQKFLFEQIAATATDDESLKDPKTRLQELLQPATKKPVEYKVEQQDDTVWFARAISNNCTYGQAIGKTKNEAMIKAAEDALKKLKIS